MTIEQLENIKPLYANSVKGFFLDLETYGNLKPLLLTYAKELGIEKKFHEGEKNYWNIVEDKIKRILSNINEETYILFELHEDITKLNSLRADLVLLGNNKQFLNQGYECYAYIIELKSYSEDIDLSSKIDNENHPFYKMKKYISFLEQKIQSKYNHFLIASTIWLYFYNSDSKISDQAKNNNKLIYLEEWFKNIKEEKTQEKSRMGTQKFGITTNQKTSKENLENKLKEWFSLPCGEEIYNKLFLSEEEWLKLELSKRLEKEKYSNMKCYKCNKEISQEDQISLAVAGEFDLEKPSCIKCFASKVD